MFRRAKVLIKNSARKLGYDVRRLGASPLRGTIAESYQLLARLNFCPQTVIDVGVATGTFELYDAFPRAELLLIEPLAEFESDLARILRNYRGSYVLPGMKILYWIR